MSISKQELQAVVDSISVLQGENKAHLSDFLAYANKSVLMAETHYKIGVFTLYQAHSGAYEARNHVELPRELLTALNSLETCKHPQNGAVFESHFLHVIQGQIAYGDFTVLFCSHDYAHQVWKNSFDNTSFTKAECKLLVHLVSGLSLKESAALDEVSTETKRSHLASIFSKTGTSRQGDLTSKLIAQLLWVYHGYLEKTKSPYPKDLTYYHRTFLPKSVRLHVLTSQAGHHVRVFDMGPTDGHPLMILHPMVLPHIGEQEIAYLNEQGLRLLWPMRHGELDSDVEAFDFGEHVAHALSTIELTRETFFTQPMDLVCLITSCFYGIEYADRFNEHVGKIFYVGACHKPNRSTSMAGLLRNGLIGLAGLNEITMNLMVDYLGRQIKEPATLEKMLTSIYKENTADREIIDLEYSDPSNISYRFAKSVKSIRHDFFLQLSPNWKKATWLGKPQYFLHGEQDHIHNWQDVKQMASQIDRASFELLPDCGQLIYMHHFKPTMQKITTYLT